MTPPLPQDLLPSLYRKRPVHHLYPDLADVPEPFLLEWFKDRYDYPRLYTTEGLKTMTSLPPEPSCNGSKKPWNWSGHPSGASEKHCGGKKGAYRKRISHGPIDV